MHCSQICRNWFAKFAWRFGAGGANFDFAHWAVRLFRVRRNRFCRLALRIRRCAVIRSSGGASKKGGFLRSFKRFLRCNRLDGANPTLYDPRQPDRCEPVRGPLGVAPGTKWLKQGLTSRSFTSRRQDRSTGPLRFEGSSAWAIGAVAARAFVACETHVGLRQFRAMPGKKGSRAPCQRSTS